MGENVVGQVAAIWDGQAAHFDDEPDHGLRDDAVRRAWIDHLRSWLPEPPADLVDLGCGTGSLSVLLAEQGHRVVGVDVSAQMIQHARRKAATAGVAVTFHVADATVPPVEPTSMDVVLVRHLVWTLPDPHAAIANWVGVLRRGGVLVMVEGRWAPAGSEQEQEPDGLRDTIPWYGGVDAETLAAAVRPWVAELVVHDLAAEERLWGGPVADERFVLVARALPE
jgi:ubiquinone/menaquinone biosynthesis C-methylase UbiE